MYNRLDRTHIRFELAEPQPKMHNRIFLIGTMVLGLLIFHFIQVTSLQLTGLVNLIPKWADITLILADERERLAIAPRIVGNGQLTCLMISSSTYSPGALDLVESHGDIFHVVPTQAEVQMLMLAVEGPPRIYKLLEEVSARESMQPGIQKRSIHLFVVQLDQRIKSLNSSIEIEISTMKKELETCNWTFRGDSDVYIVVTSSDSDDENGGVLFELYILNGVRYVKMHRLEYFLTNFVEFTTSKQRRGNLSGSMLKVVAVDDPDYLSQCHITVSNGKPVIEGGLCKEYLEVLSLSLNFGYEPIISTEWIHIAEDGKMHGIGRYLETKEADIAVSLSTLTKDRLKRLTFLQPLRQTFPHCYFIQPKEGGHLPILHLTPFTNGTWASVLGVWVLIIVVGVIFVRVKKKFHAVETVSEFSECASHYEGDVLLWSLAMMTQQGWYYPPKTLSLRIAAIVSLFFGLVIYVAYSASMVSNLSSDVMPIKNIRELLTSKIRVYVDSGVPYFLESLRATYQEYMLEPEPDESSMIGLAQGIHAIMNHPETPQTALVSFVEGFTNSLFNLNYSKSHLCKLTRFKVHPIAFHSWNLRKGSPLKELIAHRMLLAREAGAVRTKRFFNEELQLQYGCTKEKAIRNLGLMDVSLAFYIMIIGLGLSIIVLIVEHVLWRVVH